MVESKRSCVLVVVAVVVLAGTGRARGQTPCGAPGQRACCIGERASPCNGGLVELPRADAGRCGGFNPFGIQSSSVCSVTTARPSDVFFFTTPPGPQLRRFLGVATSGLDVLNRKSAASIIARDVVVRGWLAPAEVGSRSVPTINAEAHGIEDALYVLVVDIDDAIQRYGTATGHALASAVLPGNPVTPRTVPVRDFVVGGPPITVRANSFWLESRNTDSTRLVGLHMELNANAGRLPQCR